MACDWIAEVGSNHNGSFDRAVELVNTAADIGCWAVKFQFFEQGKLYVPEAKAPVTMLPIDWLANLRLVASARNIRFGCSVFAESSVARVAPHVDFIKVSSYSILDMRLLAAVQETRKPVVIGTGMATLDEIYTAVALRGWNDRLTLLHCVSKYPVAAADCHLANIGVLRRTFACDVGWSDHSADRDVVKRAAGRWRATMIECHLDLRDGDGRENGGGHCWTPGQLRDTISDIRRGEVADGTAGKPVASENDERLWRADPSDGLRPSKELRTRWTDLPTTSS